MKVYIENEEWYPVRCLTKELEWGSYVSDMPEDLFNRYNAARGAFAEVMDELDDYLENNEPRIIDRKTGEIIQKKERSLPAYPGFSAVPVKVEGGTVDYD